LFFSSHKKLSSYVLGLKQAALGVVDGWWGA
jgi:hypothetical protein